MAPLMISRTTTWLLSAFLISTSLVAAQDQPPPGAVSPSTEALPPSESRSETQLQLVNGPSGIQSEFNIAPLTSSAGKGLPTNNIAGIKFNGTLVYAAPSNVGNVTTSDIAYIECDPNTQTSNIDASGVVGMAASIKPKAIVLFSLSAPSCNLTSPYNFGSMYTMTNTGDAQLLMRLILASPQVLEASVALTNHTGDSNSSTTANDGGPAPTTAVAMSILYSITGIITLLFLAIIATGAIRAHRHPERYGPRGGAPGRPRQSRAKGLARAMLETLPIVKFGDPEPAKPGSRDIELEDGNTTTPQPEHTTGSPEATAAATDAPDHQHKAPPPYNVVPVESGLGPDVSGQVEGQQTHEQPVSGAGVTPEHLGCSICTEDFVAGEDVRVLPCKHKYHPACIDPWLLNVSGTCPLCRLDLRPETSQAEGAEGAENAEGAAQNGELPPPLGETDESNNAASATDSSQHRRISRFIDLHRLRHAPAEEQIAALRRLRNESRAADNGEGAASAPETAAAQEDAEESGRRARLASRLKEKLKIRTRPMPPTPEE
ncbi:hypothetical protein F5884DRAFT_52409 [Xylogone sp. PMI_703]|nr:hypothetical protein F5884DRAFT_52409 [Xylogone sp. PMI_703]